MFFNSYKQFQNEHGNIFTDINEFMDHLIRDENFPFNEKEMREIIEKSKFQIINENNLDSEVKRVYKLIYEFLIKMQMYIFRH